MCLCVGILIKTIFKLKVICEIKQVLIFFLMHYVLKYIFE